MPTIPLHALPFPRMFKTNEYRGLSPSGGVVCSVEPDGTIVPFNGRTFGVFQSMPDADGYAELYVCIPPREDSE